MTGNRKTGTKPKLEFCVFYRLTKLIFLFLVYGFQYILLVSSVYAIRSLLFSENEHKIVSTHLTVYAFTEHSQICQIKFVNNKSSNSK